MTRSRTGGRCTRRARRGCPWVSGLLAGLVLAAVSACSVRPASEAPSNPPRSGWNGSAVTAASGVGLPVTRGLPQGRPRAVVLALHGFAEYRGAFYTLAPRLAEAGYAVYAYDQRGFGQTARRGYWPGQTALVADARVVFRDLRERYPGTPVYLLGHSMGAAVAMLAVTGRGAIVPDGVILMAPAVHGWRSLPVLQRLALRVGNLLFPGWRPRQRWAHRFADIAVTDDPWVRHVQAGDPNYLRAIRIDMIHGLVTLMDRALARVSALPRGSLILYGERDDLVPRPAFCNLLDHLEEAAPRPRLALYPKSHHYLTRDLQRSKPIADIIAWLDDRDGPLPSRAEVSAAQARHRLCRYRPAPGHRREATCPITAGIRAVSAVVLPCMCTADSQGVPRWRQSIPGRRGPSPVSSTTIRFGPPRTG